MADYSYQGGLVNNVYRSVVEGNKTLLAAAPGAGKTRMALSVLDMFCKDQTRKVLILAHGQQLLRSQWNNVFKEQNFPHRYVEFKKHTHGRKRAQRRFDRFYNENQIIIAIPQGLFNLDLKYFDLVLIDEAHHFAESDTTKGVIDRISPEFELRLTGTPSVYIGNPKWKIFGITVQELLEHKVLTDPKIELCDSHYDLKMTDYHPRTASLKVETKLYQQDTYKTVKGILHRLEGRLDGHKTMFVCQTQNQARDVKDALDKFKINNLLSISDHSQGNGNIDRFKQEKDILALVVVNRGVLGFDYPHLTNLVDISGTLNVNKLFQMLCRVVRRHPDGDIEKLFLKVASPRISVASYVVMSFVVALSHKDYYYKYKNLNSKNARVPVPEGLIKIVKEVSHSMGVKEPGKVPIPALPRLNTFKDISKLYEGGLHAHSTTSLKEVMAWINRKHSIESCLAKARQVKEEGKDRWFYRLKYSTMYNHLQMKGKLDLLDPILPSYRKNRAGIWTKEQCLELASRFKTKSSFREAHHGAFKWLKKNGFLDELKFERSIIRWDFKKAKKRILQFRTINEAERAGGDAVGFMKREYPEEYQKIVDFLVKKRKSK